MFSNSFVLMLRCRFIDLALFFLLCSSSYIKLRITISIRLISAWFSSRLSLAFIICGSYLIFSSYFSYSIRLKCFLLWSISMVLAIELNWNEAKKYILVKFIDLLPKFGVLLSKFDWFGCLVTNGLGLFLEWGFVQVVYKHFGLKMLNYFILLWFYIYYHWHVLVKGWHFLNDSLLKVNWFIRHWLANKYLYMIICLSFHR